MKLPFKFIIDEDMPDDTFAMVAPPDPRQKIGPERVVIVRNLNAGPEDGSPSQRREHRGQGDGEARGPSSGQA